MYWSNLKNLAPPGALLRYWHSLQGAWRVFRVCLGSCQWISLGWNREHGLETTDPIGPAHPSVGQRLGQARQAYLCPLQGDYLISYYFYSMFSLSRCADRPFFTFFILFILHRVACLLECVGSVWLGGSQGSNFWSLVMLFTDFWCYRLNLLCNVQHPLYATQIQHDYFPIKKKTALGNIPHVQVHPHPYICASVRSCPAVFTCSSAAGTEVPATLYNQRHPEASATVVIFPQCLGCRGSLLGFLKSGDPQVTIDAIDVNPRIV